MPPVVRWSAEIFEVFEGEVELLPGRLSVDVELD